MNAKCAKKANSKLMMIRITADLMLLFMALLLFVNFILPSMLAVVANPQERTQSRDRICVQILPGSPPLRFDSDVLLAVEDDDKVAPDLEDNPHPNLAQWSGTPAVRTVAIGTKGASGKDVKFLAALTSLEAFAGPQELKPIKLVLYRDAEMRAVAEEIREGRIDPSRPVIELSAGNGFRASIVIPPALLEKSQ